MTKLLYAIDQFWLDGDVPLSPHAQLTEGSIPIFKELRAVLGAVERHEAQKAARRRS